MWAVSFSDYFFTFFSLALCTTALSLLEALLIQWTQQREGDLCSCARRSRRDADQSFFFFFAMPLKEILYRGVKSRLISQQSR